MIIDMRKLGAKDLKIKFIESISDSRNFSYEDGNPFLIKIGTKRYFVFLKNLSPAYFKNSPDVTRVQLPYSDHFLKIIKADIPFVILGYDLVNDTMVCWNPKHVKQRLNAKSNVSLYSRESLQTKVKSNQFKSGYLSNGDRIIIFNRVSLSAFFEKIHILFKPIREELDNIKTNIVGNKNTVHDNEKLNEIVDGTLIHILKPLLKKNKVLEAVHVCASYYKGKYKSMTFNDWFKLIKKLHKMINKQV
jgi:hypothetical protein